MPPDEVLDDVFTIVREGLRPPRDDRGASSRATATEDDDPTGAWRARDPETIRALALLELRHSGLRPPAVVGGAD